MEKVPQIVTERLRAMSVGVMHPDADVLTAFAERTLSAVERASVIGHLGICSDCREIVALALPIAEGDQQILPVAKPGWLSWPVLRWGAVAAGIILVGALGLRQYGHRPEISSALAQKAGTPFDKEAKNVAPTMPTEPTGEEKRPVPPPMTSDLATTRDASGVSGIVAEPSASTALVRNQPVPKALQHGPHVQTQNLYSFQSPTLLSPAAPPAPARVLPGESAGNAPASAQTESLGLSSAQVTANNETARLDAGAAPLQSQLELRQLNSRVERSKPAVATNSAAGKVIGEPLPTTVTSVNPSASVQWNIDPSGALRRSLDQGNTWEKVDVTGTAANAPLAAFHGNRVNAITDAKQKDALKKEVTAPVFRAVASNGPDVWAGTSGGLLYHSTDAGFHWTEVVPASSNARLSGDVVSLEFPDPQHGRVVTSVAEVWTTADGGQTWAKQ